MVWPNPDDSELYLKDGAPLLSPYITGLEKTLKANFPGAEYNNYGVTDKMREDIVTSVNWALKHPFSVTEE